MRAACEAGAHHDDGREDVEHGQRADQVVVFGEEQLVAQPAVIDHAGIEVLRHFRHARRTAGMKVGADAVGLAVLELEGLRLGADGLGEGVDLGFMLDRDLGADERHDQLLHAGQVAVQIDLDHVLDVRSQLDGFGGLLGHVGFREGAQRDQHLGLGLLQDRADLFGVQQRVDRVDDPRDHAAHIGDDGFVAVGQEIRDLVLLAHPQIAHQIGELRHLAPQVVPGQRFGPVVRPRKHLIRDRRARSERVGGPAQHFPDRDRQVAFGPGRLILDRLTVGVVGISHCLQFLPLARRCGRNPDRVRLRRTRLRQV